MVDGHLEEALVAFQERWIDLLAKKKSAGPETDFKDDVELGDLDIIHIRRLLHAGFNELEGLREGLASTRGGIDLIGLQLQNELYIKNYYEKEINACHNFK